MGVETLGDLLHSRGLSQNLWLCPSLQTTQDKDMGLNITITVQVLAYTLLAFWPG